MLSNILPQTAAGSSACWSFIYNLNNQHFCKLISCFLTHQVIVVISAPSKSFKATILFCEGEIQPVRLISVTSGVLLRADMKRSLRCADLADDAHHNLVQWSLAVRLFRDECDTDLNCSRTAPWDRRLPQRADLEHRCLMLKLLSKKAHQCSIFCTTCPSRDGDDVDRRFCDVECFFFVGLQPQIQYQTM